MNPYHYIQLKPHGHQGHTQGLAFKARVSLPNLSPLLLSSGMRLDGPTRHLGFSSSSCLVLSHYPECLPTCQIQILSNTRGKSSLPQHIRPEFSILTWSWVQCVTHLEGKKASPSRPLPRPHTHTELIQRRKSC